MQSQLNNSTNIEEMTFALKQLADIQFGLYIRHQEPGKVAYIQAKYFNEKGILSYPIDTYINIGVRDEAHLLQDGDLVFISKGFRFFAWTYRSSIGPAIASSIFFVIRPDKTRVVPEYLTMLFNMPDSISYFEQLSAGSSIPSIRKSELGEFKVKLPPLNQQQHIAALFELHQRAMALNKELENKRSRLLQATINEIQKQY